MSASAPIMPPMYLLASYAYHKSRDLDAEVALIRQTGYAPRLLADSGAFSIQNCGLKLNLDTYAEWVKRWDHVLDAYICFDAIGDPQGTLENQKRLEDLGLCPLPVFHYGEPWRFLDHYAARYDRLCLGGLVGIRPHLKPPFLAACFERLPETTRVHGLGLGAGMARQQPFDSVDSSDWCNTSRYGRLVLFDAEAQKVRFIKFDDGPKTPWIAEQLRAMGLPLERLGCRRWRVENREWLQGLQWRQLRRAYRCPYYASWTKPFADELLPLVKHVPITQED